MLNDNSLLNTRKFLPLFATLFMTASSDNLLRSAILVMLTYNGVTFLGLSKAVAVNLATLSFLLPFFIFSSYAGKLADIYSKVAIIKVIKLCEFLIVIVASIGFYYRNAEITILSLFMMGIHSTFFSPIKYSILPQYFDERRKLLLANGFVEAGTFVAVLIGQTVGTWNMADNRIDIVLGLLLLAAILSLITTYRMAAVIPTNQSVQFHKNLFSDLYHTYKEVMQYQQIRNNLHALSWFWAFGVILNSQLPVFTQESMCGNAYVYSVLLAVFSVSIGCGSLFCATVSRGKIYHGYVLVGAGLISVFMLGLVLLNHGTAINQLGIANFVGRVSGIGNFILIILLGFCAGLYSVTCYSSLQVITPPGMLSRVIAMNNVLNACYMVGASITCTVLVAFISIRWLFSLFVIANFFFVIWYYLNVYRHAQE